MTFPSNATPADIAADQIIEAMSDEKWDDDYILTHQRLDGFIGTPQPSDDTKYVDAKRMCLQRLEAVENVKDVLLERFNVALHSEPGAGYSIIPSGDQVGWAVDIRRRRIQKALAKSRLRIFHVDTSLLTVEQNRQRTDELAQVTRLQSIHRKGN